MCVLTGQQMEGPFFVDSRTIRQDITEGKEGLPLTVRVLLVDAQTCAPIRDAMVSIWHNDAEGYYSDYPNPPDGPEHVEPESNEIWLRGVQVTDATGAVEFRTILPGWYSGRVPHIHFKVVIDSNTLLTSQMYFPEQFTNALYAGHAPYNARPNPDTTHATDMVLQGSGIADAPMLTVTEDGAGYLGQLTIGVLGG